MEIKDSLKSEKHIKMLHPEPIKFPQPTEERLYIISVRNNWGVYTRHGKRSLRNFKHRELAFLHAVRYAKNREVRIIVHNKDGSMDFTYNTIKNGRK